MFKFHDINQNSDEWYHFRAGKITGSKLGTIMANYGKPFGEPANKYAVNIAIEQITGNPIPSHYTNTHMVRGHEQEPIARDLYEQETFCEVTNGGFFDSKFIGMSPDGLIDDDGVIEIKSVITSVHYANIKREALDPAYKWQCIGNLKFSGRDWLDFISFCADFPIEKQLFIHRINKGDFVAEFNMIDKRIEEFKLLVEESKNKILNSHYGNY